MRRNGLAVVLALGIIVVVAFVLMHERTVPGAREPGTEMSPSRRQVSQAPGERASESRPTPASGQAGESGTQRPANDVPQSVPVNVASPITIRGNVVSALGSPIAKAKISALSSGSLGWGSWDNFVKGVAKVVPAEHGIVAETDDKGHFQIVWPEGRRATLCVEADMYARSVFRNVTAQRYGGEVVLRLQSACELEGEVVPTEADLLTTLDTTGLEVHVLEVTRGGETEERGVTRVLADRKFRVGGLARGEYLVACFGGGIIPARVDRVVVPGPAIQIRLERPKTAPLQGRVLSNDERRSVPGARVTVDPQIPGCSAATAVTDSDGAFSFSGIPIMENRGITAIRIHIDGGAEGSLDTEFTDWRQGPGSVVLVLAPVFSERLKIRVVRWGLGEDTKGVSGLPLRVKVWWKRSQDIKGQQTIVELTATTSEGGTAEIKVPPVGFAGISVEGDASEYEVRPKGWQLVEDLADAIRNGVTVPVSLTTTVKGTVVSEEGSVVPNATVSIASGVKPGGRLEMASAGSIITDEQGRFTVSGVTCLTSELRAYAEAPGFVGRRSDAFSGQPGGVCEGVCVRLARAWTVTGTVVERGSQSPVASAVVSIFGDGEGQPRDKDGRSAPIQRVLTDQEGGFRFDVTSAGPFRVEAEKVGVGKGVADDVRVRLWELRLAPVVLEAGSGDDGMK